MNSKIHLSEEILNSEIRASKGKTGEVVELFDERNKDYFSFLDSCKINGLNLFSGYYMKCYFRDYFFITDKNKNDYFLLTGILKNINPSLINIFNEKLILFFLTGISYGLFEARLLQENQKSIILFKNKYKQKIMINSQILNIIYIK